METDIKTGKEFPMPSAGILDIAAYVPGKSTAAGGARLHKMSSNESPLGPGPKARDAISQALSGLERYPDPSSSQLRDAIAKTYGLNADNIVCGNGSDDLLAMLANCYLSTGDEAIYSEHGFSYYPIVIQAAGGVPVVATETEYTTNVDAILKLVSEKTRMVFLANPNNPTGTYLPIEEVRRLHNSLPGNVVLILDAAYAEYVRRNDYESGIELVSNSQNVVMTRTFSKIHGLAALRIGWCYAPLHVVDVINRVRGPFNVNRIAQSAGAAAISDRAHIDRSIAHNEQWLNWAAEKIRELGLTVTPSVCNFLLIHFGKHDAHKADNYLSDRGYVLRAVKGYGFPNSLRMTIGTEEANRGVISALSDFLEITNG